MANLLLRLAAFLLGIGLAFEASAQCPPGFPPGTMCRGLEDYTYTAPATPPPITPNIRIPAIPSAAPGSIQYIQGNQLLTLSDPQTIRNKVIDCSVNTCLNWPLSSVTGNLSVNNLGGGIGANANTAFFGDGTWKVPGGGGGGSGFPITLGSTAIPPNGSVSNINTLSLSNSTLAGTVAGTPNYTGVPTYTGLSAGTPVACLALDAGQHLITTPVVGGSCGGGGGGGGSSLTGGGGGMTGGGGGLTGG
jgi:hypothetical protein